MKTSLGRKERVHAIVLSTVLLTIIFGIGIAALRGTLAEGAPCTSYNGYGGYGTPQACKLATTPFVTVTASALSVFVDEPVTFTATATIKSGRIVLRRWDLNDDGAFDDAEGLTAVRTFSTPGPHRVTFKAVDRDGDEGKNQVVVVSAERPAPPPPPPPPPVSVVAPPPPAPTIKRQPSLQTAFVTRRARRGGKTLGTLVGLRVRAPSGARLNVVCIRSCGGLQIGRRLPTRSSGKVSFTLSLPSPVRISKDTTIEIRSAAAGYAQRFERFTFRRTAIGVFARQVSAGCLMSQKPRRTVRCPPA